MSYAISGNVASMSRKYEPPFHRGRWYNIHCQGNGAGDTGEQKTHIHQQIPSAYIAR